MDAKQVVEALIKKAGDCAVPAEALHLSQAALNAANALRVLADFPKEPPHD
jgi:hypothetical protein